MTTSSRASSWYWHIFYGTAEFITAELLLWSILLQSKFMIATRNPFPTSRFSKNQVLKRRLACAQSQELASY